MWSTNPATSTRVTRVTGREGETHFRVKIASDAFAGKSRVEAHRMVMIPPRSSPAVFTRSRSRPRCPDEGPTGGGLSEIDSRVRLGVWARSCLNAAVLPAAAADFSVTGTYQGFFTCDDIAGGGRGIRARDDDGSPPVGRPHRDAEHDCGRSRRDRNRKRPIAGGSRLIPARRSPAVPKSAAGRFRTRNSSASSRCRRRDDRSASPPTPCSSPTQCRASAVLVVESCKWALTEVSTETPQFEPCL